jgi:hypothetical protein
MTVSGGRPKRGVARKDGFVQLFRAGKGHA